jgi:hypothetical protein
VAKKQEGATAAAPRQGGREVGTAAEIAIRVVAGSACVLSQDSGIGLPSIELPAEARQSTSEDVLDVAFPGRLARSGEVRVHAGDSHKLLQQCDRLFVTPAHG